MAPGSRRRALTIIPILIVILSVIHQTASKEVKVFKRGKVTLVDETQFENNVDYNFEQDEDDNAPADLDNLYDEKIAALPRFILHKKGEDVGLVRVPIVTRRGGNTWSTPRPKTVKGDYKTWNTDPVQPVTKPPKVPKKEEGLFNLPPLKSESEEKKVTVSKVNASNEKGSSKSAEKSSEKPKSAEKSTEKPKSTEKSIEKSKSIEKVEKAIEKLKATVRPKFSDRSKSTEKSTSSESTTTTKPFSKTSPRVTPTTTKAFSKTSPHVTPTTTKKVTTATPKTTSAETEATTTTTKKSFRTTPKKTTTAKATTTTTSAETTTTSKATTKKPTTTVRTTKTRTTQPTTTTTTTTEATTTKARFTRPRFTQTSKTVPTTESTTTTATVGSTKPRFTTTTTQKTTTKTSPPPFIPVAARRNFFTPESTSTTTQKPTTTTKATPIVFPTTTRRSFFVPTTTTTKQPTTTTTRAPAPRWTPFRAVNRVASVPSPSVNNFIVNRQSTTAAPLPFTRTLPPWARSNTFAPALANQEFRPSFTPQLQQRIQNQQFRTTFGNALKSSSKPPKQTKQSSNDTSKAEWKRQNKLTAAGDEALEVEVDSKERNLVNFHFAKFAQRFGSQRVIPASATIPPTVHIVEHFTHGPSMVQQVKSNQLFIQNQASVRPNNFFLPQSVTSNPRPFVNQQVVTTTTTTAPRFQNQQRFRTNWSSWSAWGSTDTRVTNDFTRTRGRFIQPATTTPAPVQTTTTIAFAPSVSASVTTSPIPKPPVIQHGGGRYRGPTYNCRILMANEDGRPSPRNDYSCRMKYPGFPADSNCRCTYEVGGRDEHGCATGFLYTCHRI